MSWTDTCDVCGQHRTDCKCGRFGNVDGKYNHQSSSKNITYKSNVPQIKSSFVEELEEDNNIEWWEDDWGDIEKRHIKRLSDHLHKYNIK